MQEERDSRVVVMLKIGIIIKNRQHTFFQCILPPFSALLFFAEHALSHNSGALSIENCQIRVSLAANKLADFMRGLN